MKVFCKPSSSSQCTTLLLTRNRKRTQKVTLIVKFIARSLVRMFFQITQCWAFLIHECFYTQRILSLNIKTNFNTFSSVNSVCSLSVFKKTHSDALQSYFSYDTLLFSIGLITIWETRDFLSYVFIFWSASFDGKKWPVWFIVVSLAPRRVPDT